MEIRGQLHGYYMFIFEHGLCYFGHSDGKDTNRERVCGSLHRRTPFLIYCLNKNL